MLCGLYPLNLRKEINHMTPSSFLSSQARRNLNVLALAISASAAAMHAPVFAADDADSKWFKVTYSTTHEYHGKTGSGTLFNVGGKKDNAYGFVLQSTEKSTNKLTYENVFTTLDDCRRGFGFVVYNDTEGNFIRKAQFVRYGQTVTDAIGTGACSGWDHRTKVVSLPEPDKAWQEVATAVKSGGIFSAKVGSLNTKRNYKGSTYRSALIAYDHENKVVYSEYLIPVKACVNRIGIGKAYEVDFEGVQKDAFDFDIDGKSVGSMIANSICKMS